MHAKLLLQVSLGTLGACEDEDAGGVDIESLDHAQHGSGLAGPAAQRQRRKVQERLAFARKRHGDQPCGLVHNHDVSVDVHQFDDVDLGFLGLHGELDTLPALHSSRMVGGGDPVRTNVSAADDSADLIPAASGHVLPNDGGQRLAVALVVDLEGLGLDAIVVHGEAAS